MVFKIFQTKRERNYLLLEGSYNYVNREVGQNLLNNFRVQLNYTEGILNLLTTLLILEENILIVRFDFEVKLRGEEVIFPVPEVLNVISSIFQAKKTRAV